VTAFLNGDAVRAPDPRGRPVVDDSFLVMFNAHHEALDFTVPPAEYGAWWGALADTADDDGGLEQSDAYRPGEVVVVAARSVVVLRRPRDTAEQASTVVLTGVQEEVRLPGPTSASRALSAPGATLPPPRPAPRLEPATRVRLQW